MSLLRSPRRKASSIIALSRADSSCSDCTNRTSSFTGRNVTSPPLCEYGVITRPDNPARQKPASPR